MIGFFRRRAARRSEQRQDAESFHKLRSEIAMMHRWCAEFSDIDAATTYLLHDIARWRGEVATDPDIATDVPAFREALRRARAQGAGAPS